MKLDALKAGLAFGIIWSASMVFIAIMVGVFNWGNKLLEVIASVYLGYAPSLLGGLIGMVWGFVDGFVFGFLIVWLYNLLAK